TGDPLAFLRAAQDFKPSFGSCLSRFSHLILCEYLRPILQRKCLVTAPNEASSVEDLCDFVSRIVKQSIARDSPFISADVNVVIWAIGYIERSDRVHRDYGMSGNFPAFTGKCRDRGERQEC